jgi:putative ABC transport system substrate-binding protein
MAIDIRRRQFISALGGAAAALPLTARAQQPTMPVIGYLYAGSPEAVTHLVAAFRLGLSETGYVEGQNVSIEFRWALNENARLPELASELVRRRVAVITTPASTPAALAAKAATMAIPIVFYVGTNPVELGLVASLNRPGGNITGVTSMSAEMAPKRLGLLRELLPGATRFAILLNPDNPQSKQVVANLPAAALAVGGQIEFIPTRTSRDIDLAFASLDQKRADAILIIPDALFTSRRVQLVGLAFRHGVPAIFPFREDAIAGGLMSYGTNLADLYRQTGVYTGRILKGENPADLPVIQASKFEFIINLQTSKTIGVEIPITLLARADEVIE